MSTRGRQRDLTVLDLPKGGADDGQAAFDPARIAARDAGEAPADLRRNGGHAGGGSRLGMIVLAAKREVVIQSDPIVKLYTAGFTSGRHPERSASMPIEARPRIALASRVSFMGKTLEAQVSRDSRIRSRARSRRWRTIPSRRRATAAPITDAGGS